MKYIGFFNKKEVIIFVIFLIVFLLILFCNENFRYKLYDMNIIHPFTAEEQFNYAQNLSKDGKNKVKKLDEFIETDEKKGDLEFKSALVINRNEAEKFYNEEAFKWYYKSAVNGNEKAQCIVGMYFFEGKFVKQDYDEAFKWFLKSAIMAEKKNEQDSFESYVFYLVGYCYYYGYGTSLDLEEAKIWLEKSADLGSEEALKLSESISMKIASNKLSYVANGIKNPKGRNLRITGSVVCFRKEPKGESLGYFDKDEIVTILSDEGNYYCIRRGDGSTGYVFAYYCKIE